MRNIHVSVPRLPGITCYYFRMEMEMPGRRRVELDKLAKKGYFKTGDEPGTDTYDDGMNEKGEVVMPGSTSTGSGGNYMEDKGPNDLRRRNEEDVARAKEGGLSVVEPDEIVADNDLYAGEDAAAKWLRENDPKFNKRKGGDDLREAA